MFYVETHTSMCSSDDKCVILYVSGKTDCIEPEFTLTKFITIYI